MKIDFDSITQIVMPEFKNGVKNTIAKTYMDSSIKIMKGTLEVGASIGFHRHETNSEIIYILNGCAKILYDDTEEFLTTGNCHYCKKNHSHSLINNGKTNLDFFAIVPEL